jgi:predicted dehydrogenase
MKINRRKFIRQSSAGAIAFGAIPFLSAFSPGFRLTPPSERIRIGVIGAKGMGWANMRAHLIMPEAECVAICDVDQSVIDQRVSDYSEMRKNAVDTYKDYRKLLDRDDIDAVIIGTPDHWHCRMMVDAVEAGKHVYVEKPLANTIEECNLMVKAAKENQKVVQVGQWQRSGSHYKEAIDIVRSGKLGNIRLVKVWAYQGWMKPVPVLPDSAPPPGVDYAMWLGPAPARPFNPNRFHFNFRWFWDYAGGLMTDWGVHEIDIALYAMGIKAPKSVIASGGKFAYPDDASETPDTLQAVFEYESFNMLWEQATGIDMGNYGKSEGIAFIGNNGSLVLNRRGYELLVEREPEGFSATGKFKMDKLPPYKRPEDADYLSLHVQNFVAAMKANDPSLLNTPIESGSVAAINAHMGNIAFKTGKKIFWNQEKGAFEKNGKANKLIRAKYHNGWKVPR